MFSGPMFRREYRAATRGRRPFTLRATLATILGLLMLGAGYLIFWTMPPDRMSPPERVVLFGRTVFLSTIVVEIFFLLFFIPSLVGGAVAQEREKDTLGMLLLTRLTPWEIVLIKMVARWVPAFHLLLTGLPAMVVGAWLAGLGTECLLAVVALVSTSAFMAALAIQASAQRDQVGTAQGQAMGAIFGWLLVPPVVALTPITVGGLWGDLLDQLKTVCIYVAPSSPISLITDPGWYNGRPGAISLEGRIAILVGLQAVLGLVLTFLAAGRLQARERNPNWIDPSRGFRPPCGDDPIFWREFDLPNRRGGGSLIALRLRYVWILIRAVVFALLALVGTLILLAAPIGLAVAAAYFGTAAFRELWQHGYGLQGPFQDRAAFNFLMRSATAVLAFFPCLSLSAVVAGRVTTEREKKTWDIFLTTPLDAGEVLASKTRVGWHTFWQTAWILPYFWVQGLACGVLTPWGIALAALDLAALVWLEIALGLSMGLRPAEPTAVTNRITLTGMAVLLVHAPMLYLSLASPRDLAEAATWAPWLWWSTALGGLVVPAITGLVAWALDRQTRTKFDLWVDRPRANGGDLLAPLQSGHLAPTP